MQNVVMTNDISQHINEKNITLQGANHVVNNTFDKTAFEC
jgi:hypothetical protein